MNVLKNEQNSLMEISYENFVCYFENYYISELSSYRVYERRLEFLKNLKLIAIRHKTEYEWRHGEGSYQINLGRYGSLNRTPLQIIEGDFNCTHLLMPKIAHNYITRFRQRGFYYGPENSARWALITAQ